VLGESFCIDKRSFVLGLLCKNLIYESQVLVLLSLSVSDAFHVPCVVNVPISGLVLLVFLREALEVNFARLLSQVEGLCSVFNKSV